ncbi:MAG TPA: hypothetical protein VN325_04440 [Steroidobacteraceae bacterium]|nr:hypothetical protein [Steroidobacteraceae bacterium]
MSPDEIRAIAQVASEEGHYSVLWAYLGLPIASLLGAYLGSYLKQKGAERATKESFDEIRAQLQKTTHDTEEIKGTLSGRFWLSRQQWAIREQQYAGLLRHLTILRNSLLDQSTYFIQPGSEYDQSISGQPHFQELARCANKSYQAVRRLVGPAAIFLSPNAIGALEALVKEHWHIENFSSCTEEYVSSALRLVEAAYTAILIEARRELAQPGR